MLSFLIILPVFILIFTAYRGYPFTDQSVDVNGFFILITIWATYEECQFNMDFYAFTSIFFIKFKLLLYEKRT